MRHRVLAAIMVGIALISSTAGAGTGVKVVRRGPRTKIVVHRGFPLVRPLPPVVVVRPRAVVRVAPIRYLAPVVWTAVVIARAPAAADLSWRDSQAIEKGAGWTDFTLNADARGRKLFVEIGPGAARLNFAEVVFENGDTQVVDFAEHVRAPGLYSLLDFADGRKVAHVRMVASAESDTATISLRLLK